MVADTSPEVLVVEDQPALADLYRTWLADDYHVRVANEGTAALSALDERTDVVLLDRRIPDLSGDEVLADIRTRGLDCRVAMVTAVTPDADVIEMGFDDYLVKPVSAEELTDVVERLLRRSAHTADVQEYFSLAAKKAVLDAEHGEGELPRDGAYAELESRLREKARELESTIRQLERADYEVLFYDLDTEFRPDRIS